MLAVLLALPLLVGDATPVLPNNPNGPPPSILIMPLHADAALGNSAHALDEMILTAVTRYHRYQVLGPEDINALLGVEKMKDAVGCTDVSCAAEIGGALGAPYLLAGSMTKLGDDVSVSVRLLDTRAAKVLSRGSAHGGTSADELTAIMAEAVSEAFGIPVEIGRALRTGTAPPPPPTQSQATQPSAEGHGPDVHAYQAMMMELSKRMSNKEYDRLLADLDAYDKQNIVGPQGTDAKEVLTFYRAFACYMLQNMECVRTNAKRYLEVWPDGMYKAAVKSYTHALDQQQKRAVAMKDELAEKLAEIEKLRVKKSLTDAQAEAINASLYAAFGQPGTAAKLYEALMEHAQDENQWFDLADHCAQAHAANHAIGEARKILEAAKARNAQIFVQRGMNRELDNLED